MLQLEAVNAAEEAHLQATRKLEHQQALARAPPLQPCARITPAWQCLHYLKPSSLCAFDSCSCSVHTEKRFGGCAPYTKKRYPGSKRLMPKQPVARRARMIRRCRWMFCHSLFFSLYSTPVSISQPNPPCFGRWAWSLFAHYMNDWCCAQMLLAIGERTLKELQSIKVVRSRGFPRSRSSSRSPPANGRRSRNSCRKLFHSSTSGVEVVCSDVSFAEGVANPSLSMTL